LPNKRRLHRPGASANETNEAWEKDTRRTVIAGFCGFAKKHGAAQNRRRIRIAQ